MRQRPSREKVLMEMAEVQAQRSTCARAQVGVVIARDGRVLVTGYNGAPSGVPHCDHSQDDQLARQAIRRRAGDGVPKGCTIAVHAEANAVAYAARFGVALGGSTLYTTYSPCLACAQVIINAGVERVVALKKYRISDGENLVRQSGLSMVYFEDVR